MLDNYHILVLDDSPVQCMHVEVMLREVGFSNIVQAHTAQEGLERMRDQPDQIVILDLDMPDTDGVQFIDRIASHGFTPMLAISSSHSRRIVKSVSLMAKERGFPVIGHFPKPFSLSHAHQLRRQCLAFREASNDLPQSLLVTTEPQPCISGEQWSASALRQALLGNAIQGRFQPKVSLHTGRIIGAEVLARYIAPHGEESLPESFLPAIRRHGMEQELVFKMLNDGLQAHRTWRKLGYHVPIAVNLPVPLLQIADLPDRLHAAVTATGIAPGCVCFELLEDDAVNAPSLYYMGASRMRLKGFGLAQDDFGRGHSTMYNLISTPFTELKIDRAFVSGAWNDEVRSAALICAITLGKELGLSVTAEGVETQEDMDFIKRIGCDYAQGFFISAAVNTKQFFRVLEQLSPVV
ncbi:MAG: EAL domain-containing response regulator [Acidovorax sp.]|jgi:EAL domain-containing protein (putative c-di-GMP-specific phosphodiesterase class I)|nr:EAL domain-containing response regulator [Acidovorax sp.]